MESLKNKEEFKIELMSAPKLQRIVLDTKACGPIAVYLHGGRTGKDVAAITVHDLGCNHHEFYEFVTHEHMMQVTQRFCDSLELKHVVLLGDGAGANILARLAMLREDITLGAILIHCTGTTAGFMESLRDKINGWKLNTIGMNPSVESYLLLHRFGLRYVDRYFETPEKVSECVQNFLQGLGVASGAVNRRLSSTGSIPRPRNRSASMDEYDQPQGFKNLLYDNKRKYAAGGVIQDIEETDA
nr:unnamed protein product [Spirometra erinaceieuropaei]